MLKYGNREIRNLQEQVLENMKDIANLKEGTAVLSEFGIKVVGEVETIADLPTVLEYKSEHEDWAYGDAYAVGTTSPYTLYILTRENDTHDEDYWFDIGVFPAVGPQGEQGPRGETGPQGQTGATGEQGASAGFGTITATAETLSPGSSATATVVASGPDTAKELSFTFGLPQGESAAFTHYVTITASTIVGGQYTGTLTLTQYNTLYDNYDSVVRLRSSSSLANNYYFLKKWYTSDDYIVFLGVWSLNNNDTRYYLLKIDRSNRRWTLDVGLPIKITSYNINSTTATIGQVLTADGNGGASWENAAAGLEVVSLTTYPGTLSDADYAKLNGDNGVIKYTEYGVVKYFKKQSDDGTYIYYFDVDVDNGTWWGGFKITKSNKYYNRENTYLNITSSNIKTGSLVAGQFLKSNGSGGSIWGDPPSQVQSDWNQTSQSSPAYIKNKPTIPTVPVTDVTVNGTSVLDGTTAKVVVDTVDGATDGTNWTSLTVNGTTASIPAAQVQADWTESDNTKASYIDNKPSLATVATSGSYTDLSNKPTIPAAQVNSDWNASSGVSQILNKPSLAAVATSGSYNDLTNKPTIPSVSGSYSGDYWTSINLSGTSKSLVAAGALHYQGTVGTFGDITWSNLISSSKSVKAGDFWYVDSARVLAPTASVGNLLIATTDGTGTSTTWKVLPTTNKTGTVTSVRVQATAPVQSSVSTAQSTSLNTTISLASEYGDTQNPYGSKTANYVLAAPNGSAGTPSFRALVKADLPTLTASDVGALPDSTVIPDAVSGTNDGTNWTSLTIGSDTYGIGGGSAPSNMVTTDTNQTITGVKTFNANLQMQGGKLLYLSDPADSSYLRRWSGQGRIIVSSPNTTKNPEIGSDLASGGGGLRIECNNNGIGWIFDERSFYNDNTATTHNLGTSANKIQDIYMAGNLSDGTNSISVANMVGKSTVSGTNDGTNWTSLTVDGVTKSIPAGGGSQKYLHQICIMFRSSSASAFMYIHFDYYSGSSTSFAQNTTCGSLSQELYEVLQTFDAAGTDEFRTYINTHTPSLLFVPSGGSGEIFFYYRPTYGFYAASPTQINSDYSIGWNSASQYATSTVSCIVTDNVQTL